MKKLFLFLLIGSVSLIIHAQDIKEIPLKELTFINSNFDKSQNEVTFKGGKWNSFIKLPVSANREVSRYKSMVIEIPQSSVMVRVKFISEDGQSKEFYQPVVKSELNRKLDLALVSFIDRVQEIKIEAAQSVDEAGNYHTLRIKSIYLTN